MTISAALKAHMALDNTTLTTCWKINRTDGRLFAFTEFNVPLVVDGITYMASAGFRHSAISTTAALDVDNLEVDSVLTSDTITDSDLLAGLWDSAAVEIFQVNWADLSMGKLSLRSGTIGEVRTGRNNFNAELRGLTQPLQQTIERLYSIDCDADLGDARCAKNLAEFTASGEITSVTDQAHFTAGGLAQPGEYFNYGKVRFTGGTNSGLSMEIKSHTNGGVLSLQMAMPDELSIGDIFEISAGCNKSLANCGSRFSNVVNFRGFPHIPGLDKLASGK